MSKYIQIRASRTLHLLEVAPLCHYLKRSKHKFKLTDLKRKTQSICDECQRQKRLERKKK